jgi:hypothetical protein
MSPASKSPHQHLPPGASARNKSKHRLFSFNGINWRPKPLVCHRDIVDLISATRTDTGLTVYCELETNLYPKNIVDLDEEMTALNIVYFTPTECPRRVCRIARRRAMELVA